MVNDARRAGKKEESLGSHADSGMWTFDAAQEASRPEFGLCWLGMKWRSDVLR